MADKHKLILGTANDALPIVAYGTNERLRKKWNQRVCQRRKEFGYSLFGTKVTKVLMNLFLSFFVAIIKYICFVARFSCIQSCRRDFLTCAGKKFFC